MSSSGSNYQILNSANTIIYSSTSSSTAFNYLLGSSGIANSGSSIYVASGTYTVDSTWNINKASTTITFASGATLTETAPTSLPANIIINSNNVIITGLTLNGNGLNQSPSPKTIVTGDSYNNGIYVYGSNCLIQNSIIYNIRYFGIVTYASNTGVTNCKIYNCGTNGISAYPGSPNSYFTNNEVYGCADVGINSQAPNTIITGNYVHDINPSSCPISGYQNSYEGIMCEAGATGTGNGKYLLITGNTITNCNDCGIVLAGSTTLNYIMISGNTVTNCWYGVWISSTPNYSQYNVAEFNAFTGCHNGIALASNCMYTTVYGNTYSGGTTNFANNGIGTITTAPQ
jgi:hypothetical protein